MKLKELKELGKEELLQREKTLKQELFDLNYHRKMGRVEKPARFRQIRRENARILTLLNERAKDDRKR